MVWICPVWNQDRVQVEDARSWRLGGDRDVRTFDAQMQSARAPQTPGALAYSRRVAPVTMDSRAARGTSTRLPMRMVGSWPFFAAA